MIITTCAPSPGGLPADARNFSFRIGKAGNVVLVSAARLPIAEARDSGQK
jgi:hypothetical protein